MKEVYFWFTQNSDVKRFVGNCHTCKRAKAFKNAYSDTLLPLPVPEQPWREISMDFVVELPKSSISPIQGVVYSNVLMGGGPHPVHRYDGRGYTPCDNLIRRQRTWSS